MVACHPCAFATSKRDTRLRVQRRIMSARAVVATLFAAALQFVPLASARDCFVYFGTFTNETSKGIYVSRLDTDTGKLTVPELAAAIPNPNFLAVSPNDRFLYAATREDAVGGTVSVFTRDDRSGKLALLEQKSSGGAGPCHVSVDATGEAVLVANYGGGSVKSFHVSLDGKLNDGTFIQHEGHSVNVNRQAGPHAHCIMPAPAGRFALACDLGTDKVMIYKLDSTNAMLAANDPAFATVPPGSGPRHVVFSPDGKAAYVINEMACTVTTFAWDALTGKLDARATIPLLPPGVGITNTFTAAEIAVRQDGRFVYATVRGHDSVSVLAVDGKSGSLSLVENLPCGGKTPRGMGIDPTGSWLVVANQKSETVTVFGIDAATGRLTPTGQVLSVGAPVDVKFAPKL
jgi:6-phosphogluconolactonase